MGSNCDSSVPVSVSASVDGDFGGFPAVNGLTKSGADGFGGGLAVFWGEFCAWNMFLTFLLVMGLMGCVPNIHRCVPVLFHVFFCSVEHVKNVG